MNAEHHPKNQSWQVNFIRMLEQIWLLLWPMGKGVISNWGPIPVSTTVCQASNVPCDLICSDIDLKFCTLV